MLDIIYIICLLDKTAKLLAVDSCTNEIMIGANENNRMHISGKNTRIMSIGVPDVFKKEILL